MVKIVFRKGVFGEVRTLPAVLGILDADARRRAAACGDGYEAKPAAATGGRVRGRAAVVTTGAAVRTEAREHRLANSA